MVNFVALISAFGIIAIAYLLGHGFTEATVTSMDLSKPKGTVKTIKGDNGDVIDCVDIYKQTAFNNPLIKSLQLNLNLDKHMKRDNSFPKNNKLVQGWHRNGECPFQTVPILRSRTRQTTSFKPLPAIKMIDNTDHEHAVLWTKEGAYLGASARFSVSNPRTEWNDFSLAQIWLITELDTANLNAIEAGWTVHPGVFGDNQTRFFIYWTRDRYSNTGCYNLRCPGFVQTSQAFAVGSPLALTNPEIKISVYKDDVFGDWFLKLDDELIAYWPRELFSRLKANASKISWGGEIYSKNALGHHTTTEMGNGLFPSSTRASYVRNLKVMKRSNDWTSPGSLNEGITKPKCYNLKIPNLFNRRSDWGVHFYYGGPGFSSICP